MSLESKLLELMELINLIYVGMILLFYSVGWYFIRFGCNWKNNIFLKIY